MLKLNKENTTEVLNIEDISSITKEHLNNNLYEEINNDLSLDDYKELSELLNLDTSKGLIVAFEELGHEIDDIRLFESIYNYPEQVFAKVDLYNDSLASIINEDRDGYAGAIKSFMDNKYDISPILNDLATLEDTAFDKYKRDYLLTDKIGSENDINHISLYNEIGIEYIEAAFDSGFIEEDFYRNLTGAISNFESDIAYGSHDEDYNYDELEIILNYFDGFKNEDGGVYNSEDLNDYVHDVLNDFLDNEYTADDIKGSESAKEFVLNSFSEYEELKALTQGLEKTSTTDASSRLDALMDEEFITKDESKSSNKNKHK